MMKRLEWCTLKMKEEAMSQGIHAVFTNCKWQGNIPPEPREGTQPCWHLGTSDFLNWEMILLCCFKPCVVICYSSNRTEVNTLHGSLQFVQNLYLEFLKFSCHWYGGSSEMAVKCCPQDYGMSAQVSILACFISRSYSSVTQNAVHLVKILLRMLQNPEDITVNSHHKNVSGRLSSIPWIKIR